MESWERLKVARECKGYSQQQVADMLGMKQQTYSYYESGREMKATMLKSVCKILDCTPSWMLGLREDGTASCGKNPFEVALADALAQLTDEGRRKVVDYAEDLAGNGKYLLCRRREE